MRRIILVVTLALLFGTVAQAQKARIFQVKHADVEALAGLLRVFPATINPNTELRTISAVAVDPETLTAIEEAIARFDLAPEPQKNVVLTFYLLMAGREVPAGESLPTDLDDVAEQLKSLFGYGGFLLMDTSVLRVRDGEGVQLSGAADYPTPEEGHAALYHLRVAEAMVSAGEQPAAIRLSELRFGVRVPERSVRWTDEGESVPAVQYSDIGFNTDIDIREGQKVVVGKASLDKQGNHLILVVTAEVVD